MIPQEIIRRKRDGQSLEAADIDSFIAGLTDGRVTEDFKLDSGTRGD